MVPKREKKRSCHGHRGSRRKAGEYGFYPGKQSRALGVVREREKEKESASIPSPEAHIFREQHTTFFAPQFMYQYDAESML